ncbi:DUF6228 family protein [Azospirillum sp. TSO22-1]|uniref:DUF6228 family protein n=1 Tax=Azospirillum sp. TSO22-1 TaxID=716789 RepID=UPI0011B70B21|nr:DUF6228 family protein [Azospirillum sp. TSO22-1]
MFTIRSTASDRAVSFSDLCGERFRVTLTGHFVSASAEVFAYTDADGLARFFQELGKFDAPWSGRRSWSTIEEDFRISAVCTSLGAVTLEVELRGMQGAPEEWLVKTGLSADFGQLEHIAKRALAFFNASPTDT